MTQIRFDFQSEKFGWDSSYQAVFQDQGLGRNNHREKSNVRNNNENWYALV